MPLSQKLKIAFWSFLVLVLVVFFVLYIPYLRVRLTVNTFNRWTSPSAGRGGLLKLFIASKYGTSKLKEIITKDCNAIVEYPNGHIECGTGYGYINSLKGKWFVTNVDRVILSGPDIEPNDNGYTATMTELMYEKSEIALWKIELFIKKYGGEYLISNIRWTLKNPTEDELNNLQDTIKVKRYASDKGFGGRYNETYAFSEPSFSPDGKQIAFSSLYPSSDIYIANIDGSGLKRLTNTKYWEVLPQFSPDGKNIMFLSDKENYGGEYYLIDLDGSNYRRLAPDYFGVSEACFSPDGKYIAFTSQKGLSREVYLMNADGTNIKQLTKNKCFSLRFSPNGKKLFFIQGWNDYGHMPVLTEEIFSINIDGSDFKQLTNARDENARIKKILDLTNNHIFFLRITNEYDNMPIEQRPNDHEVWCMSYNGSDRKKILGGGMTKGFYEETKVLPNGKDVVFVEGLVRKTFCELQIKELDDSGNSLQLTNNGICNSKVAVSPDNKYIAYSILPQIYSRKDEIKNLNIVSIDGKKSWIIDVNNGK
jgi:WD40 repeat protein